MTAFDRRRGIEVRPDGSLFDHGAMRAWLDQIDRRDARVTVARLSADQTAFPAPRPGRPDLAGFLGAASRDEGAPTEAPDTRVWPSVGLAVPPAAGPTPSPS
jgi:hypothetical protein